MAGLPNIVLERAREILTNLEQHSLDITNSNGTLQEGAKARKAAAQAVTARMEKQAVLPQMSLFQSEIDPRLEQLRDKLKASDPNRMTPIEALMLLSELKRLAE